LILLVIGSLENIYVSVMVWGNCFRAVGIIGIDFVVVTGVFVIYSNVVVTGVIV